MTRVVVVAGIIQRQLSDHSYQILIAKRHHSQHQGGLWEFPGGKVAEHEDHQTALARELKEELDIQVESCRLFEQICFDYPDKNVELNFYWITRFSGNEKSMEGQPLKWVALEALQQYPFPAANQPVVERLLEKFLN